VTPHDGEYARLRGAPAGDDRVGAARALARDSGCVVLLKGPTTVVADPGGRVRVVRAGTVALATAGSGDVLSGLIGATLARGHDALSAAALSAHLHGRAGARLPVYAGASQLGPAITAVLEDVDATRVTRRARTPALTSAMAAPATA
jgi:NAD(P)H-hydrate epimerase